MYELPEDAIMWKHRNGPPHTAFVRVFYDAEDSYRHPVFTCDIDWSEKSQEPILAYLPLPDWQLIDAGHVHVEAPIVNDFIEPNTRTTCQSQ